LRDPVLDRRDAQRPGLARTLGNLDAPDRLRLVAAVLQRRAQLGQVARGVTLEGRHALPIDPGRTAVRRHPPPRRFERGRPVHLVDQTEPLATLDAVAQRRQHPLRPHRCFHPAPIALACGFWPLSSGRPHCRSLLLHPSGPHRSTFLPPFPRCGFAARTSRNRHRRPCSTMKALTPARRHRDGRASPLTASHLPNVPPPTTGCARSPLSPPHQRDRLLPGFAMNELARRTHPAESSSSSYGPPVRLRLLPTPPRGDAVTFDFGAVTHPGADFHRAVTMPLRAHSFPRKRESIAPPSWLRSGFPLSRE
jgi:hypothetical protein